MSYLMDMYEIMSNVFAVSTHLGAIDNYSSLSLQPSLLAMALMSLEALDQHDPEHSDNISEALKGLQQQLNVSIYYLCSLVQCPEQNQ